MMRGIEKRNLFHSDLDRQTFIAYLDQTALDAALEILAFALMANHVHLVTRTGSRPLAEMMQRLGTRYARYFNHLHTRSGHLFQGRYKSILIEEGVHLNSVIRYVHRNPIAAGSVKSLADLERYRWTGHAGLLGRHRIESHAVEFVLGLFGGDSATARRKLRTWMSEADDESVGSWAELNGGARTPRSSPVTGSPIHRNSAILGHDAFVEEALRENPPNCIARRAIRRRRWKLEPLIGTICDAMGAEITRVVEGRRGRLESDVRAVIAHLGANELGIPFTRMAPALGVSNSALGRAVDRGRRIARDLGIALE